MSAEQISPDSTARPQVFISYTHDSPEHKLRVLSLYQRLRLEGVNCQIDQLLYSPPEGWPRWTRNRIEEVDYVLVICTETYEHRYKGKEEPGKGLGAQWEGMAITQELYESAGRNVKFIPVVFSVDDKKFIPLDLRGATSYVVNNPKDYDDLYRRLTDQPSYEMVELGEVRRMPPAQIEPLQLIADERSQAASGNKGNLLTAQAHPDWGDVLGATSFHGREKQLKILKEWVVNQSCRLVVLLGVGGTGKSALAVELIRRIQSDTDARFDSAVLRSLKDAPPLGEVIAELIKAITGKPVAKLPEDAGDVISLLIDCLMERRCLLVLDNAEKVLKEGDINGSYQPGYEGYGELLERVGKIAHRSCLILTSREKPREISLQEGDRLPVRSYEVGGFDAEDAASFLDAKGLPGTQDELHSLAMRFDGSPLGLELVFPTIKEVFNKDVGEYLKYLGKAGSDSANILGEVLDEQSVRLSDLEKQIMYWLAVNREPETLIELLDDISPPAPPPDLNKALQSLRRRSLIQNSKAGFTQHSVIMEYFTMKLIEQVCEGIKTQDLTLIDRHSLLKALVKDYVREIQIRLILKPVAERLRSTLGGEKNVESRLGEILSTLRGRGHQSGYAAGNIINLLVQLKIGLIGYDFSGLDIRQTFLRNVSLYNVNFARSHFVKSLFAEALNSILSVAFSPGGELLAAGDDTGTIHVWQVANMQKRFALKEHSGSVWSLAFSPDGQTLASCGHDKTVRLWNVATGECWRAMRAHDYWVASVAISPDGRWLASGGGDNAVRLWDIATGQCLAQLQGHTSPLHAVAFSPDSKLIASGGNDSTARLWRVEDRQSLAVLTRQQQPVLAVAFSHDGQTLATGSRDRTTCLWDIGDPSDVRYLAALGEHTDEVSAVAFMADDKTLATGSHDQTVKLWEIGNPVQVRCRDTLLGHTNSVNSIAFTQDGRLLASGSNDLTVRMWNAETGQSLRTLQGYNSSIYSVAFSRDGQTIVSGSNDKRVRLWDVAGGYCRAVLEEHKRRVTSVAVSPDGQTLASGSDDKTVRLWNINSGHPVAALREHTDPVKAVAFSPDGQTLASSGDDSLRLWETKTYRCVATFLAGRNVIGALAFSPDGQIIASNADNYSVQMWNLRTRQQQSQVFKGHAGWVQSIDFSPDGRMMATASSDSTIKLWDAQSGECLVTFEGHSLWVSSVAFSPDGQRLVSGGGGDQSIKIWDINARQCLANLESHTHPVYSVIFSPDGSKIASGSADETIRLWDVSSSALLTTMRILKPYEGMNITDATGLTEVERSTLNALGAISNVIS
jgi:WD40 repeat protein